MGGILIASLTALYVLLFLFFIIGVIRTHRYRGPKATPSVTVVVPMRNEEEFAQRTLEALAEQDSRKREPGLSDRPHARGLGEIQFSRQR